MKNLGDKIAVVAQPIAKAIDWTLGSDIQHCPGCHRMQRNLNAGMSLTHAFYDRFWPSNNNNKGTNTMQYIVNKTQTEQIAIDADNPKEAIAKVKNGEGTVTATSENCTASPRPGQPTQTQK